MSQIFSRKSIVLLLMMSLLFLVPLTVSATCACYDDAGKSTPTDAADECTSVCSSKGGGTDSGSNTCTCENGDITSIDCETTCTGASLSASDPTITSTSTSSNTSKLITPALNVQIPGLDPDSFRVTKSGNLLNINYMQVYIFAFYNYLLGISTLIAIVMVMIGGLQYTFAAGGGETGKAKKRIQDAVIGVILLTSVYAILYIVNPQLIKLEFPTLENVKRVDISNESTDFEDYEFEVVSVVGNGTGWNDVPMFDQKQFDDVPYGVCGTVKTSGCGVASFAMVASSLSGQDINPKDVAGRFGDEGYRACSDTATEDDNGGCPDCNGTYAAAFISSSYVKDLGLTSQSVALSKSAMKEAINDGALIIISYKTKGGGGHYVVITGVDSDGKVQVNNPWGGNKELRTWNQIESTIKSARALYKL